ncbi:MAG: isoprenylcysteine carboxylmethyltransferase family protein [Eubacterium sp.]|nr:isoprenylcysteine carboxylmethyltransferase family protein [Eubacterium sp.]
MKSDNNEAINDAIQNEKDKLLAEIRAEFSGEGVPEGYDGADSENEASAEPEEFTLPSDEELEESINTDPVITKVSKPLPKLGDGFKFVPITVGITAAAVVLGHIKPINYGIPSAAWLRYIYIGFGIAVLVLGIKLIVDALVHCALNDNLKMGKLATSGIYSKTRNPIYAGVILICTAALFISGNAFMYLLPIAYWIFLTKLMQVTEEPLLRVKFGDEYEEYFKKTYRFIPIKK